MKNIHIGGSAQTTAALNVTFKPFSGFRIGSGYTYFDRNYAKLLQSNGCFGLASELIDYDDKLSNIVSSLLGSTAIVNNINTAVNLAKQTKYLKLALMLFFLSEKPL